MFLMQILVPTILVLQYFMMPTRDGLAVKKSALILPNFLTYQ